MSAITLHTTTINLDDDEQIIISELSIGEYKSTLFSLVREFGVEDTMSKMANKIVTVEVSEILERLSFHYIDSWTLKGHDGKILERTYANYINLPQRIGEIVTDEIGRFGE